MKRTPQNRRNPAALQTTRSVVMLGFPGAQVLDIAGPMDGRRGKLEDSRLNIDAVASECGFGNSERRRRAFHRLIGVAPNIYRERFQAL